MEVLRPLRLDADAGTRRRTDGELYAGIRRGFRILDVVSWGGDGVTAKGLARDLGISLSTCYHLLNVLLDEGYLEKLSDRGGYRLGPTIGVLAERAGRGGMAAAVAPVLRELARAAALPAYFSVLTDGEPRLVHSESPPNGPSLTVAPGLQGAAHALALGKVLIAGGGARGIHEYIERHRLEAFTARTIVDPAALERHLKEVRARGFATDVEEFAANLCCVAVPVPAAGGGIHGALGVSTTSLRSPVEVARLAGLARRAAARAAARLDACR